MLNTAKEVFTGIIDLVLGFTYLVLILLVRKRHDSKNPQLTFFWLWAMGFLSLVSFFGFIVHTFFFIPSIHNILWQPVYFFLGLTIAYMFLGTLAEIKKTRIERYTIGLVLAGIVLPYVITLIIPGSFLVFILYEVLVLLFIQVCYFVLLIRRKEKRLIPMVWGLLLFIFSTGFQALQDVNALFVVQIDPNGLLHIVQVIVPVFFYLSFIRITIKEIPTSF